MKKLHWLGAIATILISAPAMTGCSSPDTSPPPVTTGGSGGAGGTGSTGGSGGATGVQLLPPASYVVLSGADAAPGAAAPAAWTGMSTICSSCHGPNGEGMAGLGPEVRHTPAAYAQYVIRNGRAGTLMVPFPMTTLSDADMTSIITWLAGLPKPTTGPSLYKDFCGNCHGPMQPTGGNIPISIANETIMEVNQKVRTGEGSDPSMRNLYMPPHTEAELSSAELTLIEQFIMAK